MSVVYTVKAWSKLWPTMTSKNIFLFLAVVALVLVAICTATQPSTTQTACKLTGGETVESGWTGKDTGDNSCNSCFCTDGDLGCTEMACPAHQ